MGWDIIRGGVENDRGDESQGSGVKGRRVVY